MLILDHQQKIAYRYREVHHQENNKLKRTKLRKQNQF